MYLMSTKRSFKKNIKTIFKKVNFNGHSNECLVFQKFVDDVKSCKQITKFFQKKVVICSTQNTPKVPRDELISPSVVESICSFSSFSS